MALCDQCKKDRAIDTYWDILRSWLFRHLFPKDYIDLAQEKYTNGFGEGYVKGLASAASHKEDLAKVQAQFFAGNQFFGSKITDIHDGKEEYAYGEAMVTSEVSEPTVPHARSTKRGGKDKQARRSIRRRQSANAPRDKSSR